MKSKLTGKCHGNRLFARLEDKEKTKRLFKKFDICGIVPNCFVTFEKEPWYHYCYSNVLNAESKNWTFYIPAEVRREIEKSISMKLGPEDRLLLQINDYCILIVRLSEHETSFVFTIAEKKAEEYEIKSSSATKFKILKVAKYEDIVNKIVKQYEKGESIPKLESNYPFSGEMIRRALKKNGIGIRSPSDQQTMRYHGRLPRIKEGLSEGKLKVIFAMLGDNIGNIKSKGYGVGIIGSLEFTEAFAESFEREYRLRPSIKKVKNHKAFRVSLKNVKIFADINKYAQFGANRWRLLDDYFSYIKKMDHLKIGRAISYFWEAEGCPIIRNKTIVATSVNRSGLLQIQKTMNILQIKTSITGPNYAASSNGLYTIRVSGRDNIKAFSEKVNFVSQRKKNDVEKLLSSYKRFIKIHTFEEYVNAFALKIEGFKLIEISLMLDISIRVLKCWFYESVKPRCFAKL